MDYNSINTISDLEEFKDRSILMRVISNDILKLAYLILDPYKNSHIPYTINESTIIGLFTKMTKSYNSIFEAYCNNNCEIIMWLSRPMYEAFVYLLYLIKKGEKSQEHYRLISYQKRYKTLALTEPVYDKIKDKIRFRMLQDGFSSADFQNENSKPRHQRWKLDGKNFREILREIEEEEVYDFTYGLPSDLIHSGWGEISQFHLLNIETKNSENYWIPKSSYFEVPEDFLISFNDYILSSIFTLCKWKEVELKDVVKQKFNILWRIHNITKNFYFSKY